MPQLPGYNFGNALIDFSPVANALSDIQKQRNFTQQMGMDQQKLDMEKESHALQKQNMQRQWSQQDAERAGNEAFAIQNMQGPAKGIAWQRYLKTYGDGDHSPEELDPNTGPAIAAAHAGKYIDQMKQQMGQLEMQKTRAEIGKLNREASGDVGKYGVQPIYGRDQNGNIVPLQLGSNGTAIQPKLPNGISVDLTAKAQEQAIGKERGEEIGKSQMDLQRQEDNAGLALKTIEAIRKHPGKGGALGWSAPMGSVPGTEARGFANLVDQAKGQVFLQAFNSLRGGGAITEAEGAKATQALARLDRFQSATDFDAALKDLEDVVTAGVSRARAKAGGSAAPAQVPNFGANLKAKYGLE